MGVIGGISNWILGVKGLLSVFLIEIAAISVKLTNYS